MAGQRLPYEVITDYVLDKIRTGAIGEKLPSVRELRRQFGFSIVTINKAYQTIIAQGLVDVRSGQGCFIKAHEGEVLTDQRDAGFEQSIVIAYKDYFSSTTWQVVHEIERLCRLQKFNLINYKVNSADSLDSLVEFVARKDNIAGVLVKGMEDLFHGHLDMLSALGVPIVLLDSGVENLDDFPAIRSITPDFEQSGCLMAETLLQKGCQKLVYVQTDSHQFFSIHALHKKGIRRALAEAGLSSRALISIDDSSLKCRSGGFEPGYQLALDKVKIFQKCDGALFSNTASAFAALKVFAENEIEVPQQLSVIGEGDYQYAPYAIPSLATVSFNYSDLAGWGLKTLFAANAPQIQYLEPFPSAADSI